MATAVRRQNWTAKLCVSDCGFWVHNSYILSRSSNIRCRDGPSFASLSPCSRGARVEPLQQSQLNAGNDHETGYL